MAAWKYYAAERARHPKALAHKLTRSQMVEFSGKLAEHFGSKAIPVFFSDCVNADGTASAPQFPKRLKTTFDRLSGTYKTVEVANRTRKFKNSNWSFFWRWSDTTKFFTYGVTMFNALTLAHEVAHYLAHEEYRLHCAAGRNRTYVPHGTAHAEWVDTCVAALFEMLPPADVVPFTVTFTKENGQFVETPKDPVAAFFDSLPPLLTCPCCNATLPKMNFGVRVMKRDANNVPTVIRRQSYCRACR